jgi:hemoglobin
MESVYAAAGGQEGLVRLAHAWHERVLADEIVSHAFRRGFRADHTERLAAYWAEALGGPETFTRTMASESDVVAMHSGNGVHQEMDERAVACFDAALDDVGLTQEPLRGVLHDYFAWSTHERMNAYHVSPDEVPDGLVLTRWSWDGRQG